LADGVFSGGSADAPLHPTADGPPGGAAYWLRAADGVRLRVAVWGGDAGRGTVLLFPGRTECVEKYGRTATDLLALGFASMVIDWRGQGLADRLIADAALGHVADFADYQLDVAAMLAHARALNLPQPWYLLAHSMGGCIGLRALHLGLPVRRAAFSAPMWGIGIAAPMRPVAWAVSTLARATGLSALLAPGQSRDSFLLTGAFAGNTLTSDAEQWSYMKAQLVAVPALALGGPTLRWLNAALREMRSLQALPSPTMPTVTFLGTTEGIVDPAKVTERMARWPGAELVMLSGGRHEVLLESPAIRARILARLDAHFA